MIDDYNFKSLKILRQLDILNFLWPCCVTDTDSQPSIQIMFPYFFAQANVKVIKRPTGFNKSVSEFIFKYPETTPK